MSEEPLQIAEKRREVKGKAEKERYTHLNTEFQRIARRDEAFLSDQCKEIEENNRMGKTRYLFNKIKHTRGTLHAKMGKIKDSPGSGRSPGGGNGNPLQNSCLENPMNREAWQATVQGVTKSQTCLSD